MSKLILYNYYRSSTSYRVRLALEWKGLSYEYRAVHLLKKEQLSEDFRRLNPQGEVPALVDGNKVLAQSLPILEYLDEVYPNPRLYPNDSFDRAWVRQFCENINSFMHPLANLKVQQELEKRFGADSAAKESWIQHWSSQGFEALEKMLEARAGSFCLGGNLTAADLCLIPMMFSARRFNVPLDAYPICRRIETTCLALDAFQKAHPYRQPDTPAEMRIP